MKHDFRQNLAERRMQRVRAYLRLEPQEVARLLRLIRRMPEITTDTLVFYVMTRRDVHEFQKAVRDARDVARHIEQHNCIVTRYVGLRSATGKPSTAINVLHYSFRVIRRRGCPELGRRAVPTEPFRPRLV